MRLLDLVAIFLCLSAGLAWFNRRVLHMPTTIGLLLIGALGSAGVLALDVAAPGLGLQRTIGGFVESIDFGHVLMVFMLGYLLFAGALEVDLAALKGVLWTAAALATISVILSTAIAAAGFWAVAHMLHYDISPAWALVFGALISPTDPVGVLAVLQQTKLPQKLEAMMQAEALFNDGVGIVFFTSALAFVTGSGDVAPASIGLNVLMEAGGAALLGAAAGLLVIQAMRRIDDYAVEVGLTLALATAVYALAEHLHVSGPIAVAVAGLMVGGAWGRGAMSELTQRYVRGFWRLVDQNLNALLFLLIGLEVLVLPLDLRYAGLALAAVAVVLLARLLSVAAPAALLARKVDDVGYSIIPVLTWGGVRGGISVALALALPAGEEREAIVTATYAIVLFANVAQALTLGPLIRRLGLSD